MVSCICGNKKSAPESKSHYEGFLGPIPADGAGDEIGIKPQHLSKVFISRLIDPEAVRQLKLYFDVTIWDEEDAIPRSMFIQQVEGCTVIFSTTSDIIDMEVLEAAGPRLNLVCNMAPDFGNVDVKACERRSVALYCGEDASTEATAELACTLLLMTSRRLWEGYEAAREGKWDLSMYGTGLANGVLGILGSGPVGKEIVSRMQPFELSRIIYYDQGPENESQDKDVDSVSIDEIFSLSDFIVCTLALTSETRGIVNKEKLKLCKPGCIFINTSRGPLVNHADLEAALENNQLACAALDVTDPEPLPADHPLLKLSNCIVTPHMGSATYQTRLKMAMSLVNVAINTCR